MDMADYYYLELLLFHESSANSLGLPTNEIALAPGPPTVAIFRSFSLRGIILRT